jgi:uncharacterized protein YdeI (YjbR/CyaY-like superfamily)
MNSKVTAHLKKAKAWQPEMEALRKILLSTELSEDFKWAKPCYTFGKSNLIVLCELKESCAVGFMKGALLKDAKGILIAPGEHSQSMRWAKFTDVETIAKLEPTLKAYVSEAIAAEKAGLKIEFKKSTDLVLPEELQKQLAQNAALKKAFAALTPGRQRGYHLFISSAKQSATREARVQKCIPLILQGRGLSDRQAGSAIPRAPSS